MDSVKYIFEYSGDRQCSYRSGILYLIYLVCSNDFKGLASPLNFCKQTDKSGDRKAGLGIPIN